MHDWIDLTAVWQIVVFCLLAGAGLPALFALGLRALAMGNRTGTTGDADRITVGGPTGLVLGGLCFLVILAGVTGGIYFLVAGR